MSYQPISRILPQYEDYANWWLKAYEQGTTTPKVMGDDSTPSNTYAKLELDAQGFPNTSGGARLIPWIDDAFDLWIFPTEAEADANDTTNAIQISDNIGQPSDFQYPTNIPIYFATVAAMQAATYLKSGMVVRIGELANSLWGITTATANGYDILEATGSSLQAQLKVGGLASLKAFGAKGDNSTDDTNAVAAWLDYLIANPSTKGEAIDGTFLVDSIQKTINGGLNISGNGVFKATGSNRDNMIRLVGCQGKFTCDGLTFDGNNIAAHPLRVENENSTSSTLGSVYIGPSSRFINAKNNTPDTYTAVGCFIRGGFQDVIFEGEVDGIDDTRTSGAISEGLTVTHFTTAADDWVRNTVVTGKARIRNIKNSNTVLADADGLKVDAPTTATAFMTVQAGARFEECKGRSIKSQVVKNIVEKPTIHRSLYDGLSEINLQYAGGIVDGALIHHEGTRVDSVVSITQRTTPDISQISVKGNELTVTGTTSSDTESMVQINVTDSAVKSQGIVVRDNKVKGSIEHMYRWIVSNQVDENRAIVDSNWAETISGSFLDISAQSSPAQPSIIFTNNGCENPCSGATGGSTLLVEYERNNHNITTAASEPYELTISAGAIQVYAGTHKVDTEANAATDDLDTINTDGRGQDEWLTLKLETSARTVTLKHATGNIRLDGSADFTLSDIRSSITLAYNTSIGEWNEISRVTSS